MLEALAPGFERRAAASRSRSSAWASRGRSTREPLVRERVEAAAARFPDLRRLDVPLWEGTADVFRREVADVHRELFAESSSAYGEDLAIKVEACLRVTDPEVEQARHERERYREQVEEAFAGVDLLVTPTLPCVAPPVGAGGIGDLDLRETMIALHASVQHRRPTRARAPLRCGRGRPAGVGPAGRAKRRGRARTRRGQPSIPRLRESRRRWAADNLTDDAVRLPYRSLRPRLGATRRRAGARRRRAARRAHGPEGLPAARRGADPARVLPHAVVRLAARGRRPPLRVRARHEPALQRQLDRLDERRRRARRSRPPQPHPRPRPRPLHDTGHDHRRRDDRVGPEADRQPPRADDRDRPRAARGSRARRTRSTRTSARSPRPARRRGASRSASTSAGRRSHAISTARIRGLVRWSPVEGATSYQVWLHGRQVDIRDHDQRRRRTRALHLPRDARVDEHDLVPRAREAHRLRRGRERPARRRPTARGARSTRDVQPPLSLGTLANLATVADTVNTTGRGSAHGLTPGFAFGGDRGGLMDYAFAHPAELYRVYVATDRDCVNIVYRGAIVGSPAYAPRLNGPLALPQDRPGRRQGAHEGARLRRRGRRVHARRHAVRLDRGAATATRHVDRLRHRLGLRLGRPRRAGAEDRPARHRVADRGLLLDRRARAHRPEAAGHAARGEPWSPGCHPDRVPRVGAAAGRLPVRARPPLRQDEPAGRDGRQAPLRERPVAQGQARLRDPLDTVLLRHAARRLAAGPRRPGVRGAVEPDGEPVQAGRRTSRRRRRRRCCRSRRAPGTTASAASTRSCRSSPSSRGRRR